MVSICNDESYTGTVKRFTFGSAWKLFEILDNSGGELF